MISDIKLDYSGWQIVHAAKIILVVYSYINIWLNLLVEQYMSLVVNDVSLSLIFSITINLHGDQICHLHFLLATYTTYWLKYAQFLNHNILVGETLRLSIYAILNVGKRSLVANEFHLYIQRSSHAIHLISKHFLRQGFNIFSFRWL